MGLVSFGLKSLEGLSPSSYCFCFLILFWLYERNDDNDSSDLTNVLQERYHSISDNYKHDSIYFLRGRL